MTIADIKSKLTIGQVLNHYGIKVKNKQCCCPFHDDKNPSMQVYPETNTVHCFSGNCEHTGKAIDQIDFILHKEKCTKHEAITKAKKLIGVEIIETVNKKHEIQSDLNEVHCTELAEVFAKLKEALPRSKKAIEYLESRNLSTAEVGYNPGGSSSHYNRMGQCIIFPLKDCHGQTVSFYGRSITSTGKHYYSANRSGLYPQYPSPETKQLVLTESVIDAATLRQHLATEPVEVEVLALYGTNGLTPEHMEAIRSLTELVEVIFFLDGDEAGNTAVAKYTRKLSKLLPNVTLSCVEVPQGEDPNSLTISHEPEILNHLISERTLLTSVEEKQIEQSITKIDESVKYSPKELIRQSYQATSAGKLDSSNPEYLTYEKGNLLISVLGGISLHPIDKLKITLKIERTDSKNPLHQLRHSLDLYHDDQVEKLSRKSSERLEIGSKEMLLVLAEITQSLEQYRYEQIEAKREKKPEKRQLTRQEEERAIQFLQQPNLLERTNELIGKTGMVGESTNRLLMYLVFTSRLREQPLHIVSLGASGTGKTYLQEKVSELIPEEQKLEITALSENALYYFERKELKNKLVLIEDLDGASDDKVLFAIRELQSKRRISKTIPIKDAKGNMKTITLQVEGPISLAGTTTREKLYEDNANRSLLVYLDSSKAHKEAIMDYQRKLSAGQINKPQEEEIKAFFKDMQTVLEQVEVRNPYAMKLRIPETVFKPLRSNAHYLAFIETVTFYCQYQRESKVDSQTGRRYIETTLEDIKAANAMLKEVLLGKSDELTKACREFFESLKYWLQAEGKSSFYSKQIRTAFRMRPTTLNRHLSALVKYGHVQIIGGNKARGFEYEVTDAKEYEKLKSSVGNALDQALIQLKIAI